MKTSLTLAILVVATAVGVVFYPAQRTTGAIIAPVNGIQARPVVEVVFALDTTGSMSGLIQGAKDKIWSIATTLAQAQPTPEIRMGLVAYRDRGDAYVTRTVDLSEDLDSVYAQLMELEAAGGGDGPESVNQALHDAVYRMSWSQNDSAYKVVFLVGDAPAHMDYSEPRYPEIVAAALDRGIRVNTVQCGTNQATTRMWQTIAQLNQGDFHHVDQSGGMLAIATPFDEEIARLAASMDGTRVYYGDADQRARRASKIEATAKLNAEAPAAVLARRAEFNASDAGASNLFGSDELVEAVATGRVELDAVPEEALPESLKPMSLDERETYLKETAAKRDTLRQQIADLNRQRRDYVAEQRAALPASAASLEDKVAETVARQAREKGLDYDKP